MIDLRALPSVDRLVAAVEARSGTKDLPRARVVDAARVEIDALRARLRANGTAGGESASLDALIAAVEARLAAVLAPSLRPLINASGVIIQTNLGRAPLSASALAAMTAVGGGYANLEYDLERGERGSRNSHLHRLLQQLTGAEDALAVNNNAAAIYLALSALALDREVIVSRGQAVEIGGGFRIPDVLRQSGASLVEVGTTNRTYASDYAAAINERTALLLRVHTSNFRLTGFVHETSLTEMAEVGRAHGVPVLDDLGSGTLLPTGPYGLTPEPTVQESVTAGADLVTFSGDKLLGGPQAGLIVGRAALIDKLKKHPLMRALRLDKIAIAGLTATLQSYLRSMALSEIPVWQMIATPAQAVRSRCERLVARLADASLASEVMACASAVGGGSLPGDTLASYAVALDAASPDTLARSLRLGQPPVVSRISEQKVLFDLRTVLPAQDDALVEAILQAWQGG
jgi:L-seryl-tRNA(Ser) seleniumtransferase